MLQDLRTYGNTGNESCLVAIVKNATKNSSFGDVPNDLVSKVIHRFTNVFQSTFLNDKRLGVWIVLSILCNPVRNTSATNFMRKLETSSILELRLARIIHKLNALRASTF